MKKHRYVKRDQPCVDAARLSRSLSRDVYVCSRFPAFHAECLINAINAAAFRAGKSTDEKGLARHTQALQNPPTKEKVLATETRFHRSAAQTNDWDPENGERSRRHCRPRGQLNQSPTSRHKSRQTRSCTLSCHNHPCSRVIGTRCNHFAPPGRRQSPGKIPFLIVFWLNSLYSDCTCMHRNEHL